MTEFLSGLKAEAWIYLLHVASLGWPGVTVRRHDVHRIQPGDVSAWPEDDLRLLIEEGRRQTDDQINDLERIRGRCQYTFTIALAQLALVLALVKVSGFTLGPFVLWCVAVVMTTLCMLGSASIMVAKSEFYAVDAAITSQEQTPILASIASDYAKGVGVGANTVATRLTVFRDAVWCLVVGAAFFSGAWLLAAF